jgi:hypothetical protein
MTGAATLPTTAPTTVAADLLLVRLLPPMKKPLAPARVRADVARFFREPPNDERWQDAVDSLVTAALLTTHPLRLTEAGRARALSFLGVTDLPARCNWGMVQARFLTAKALGLSADDSKALGRIGKGDNLAALLLQRRFGLAPGRPLALGEALEALACQTLGFPEATTLDEVKRIVLSRLGGLEEPVAVKDVRAKLPRTLLGARRGGIAGLRSLLLDGWAEGAAQAPLTITPPVRHAVTPPSEKADPAGFDLPAFARTVQAAARDCPTGRFGDNKVFISHVWRHLRDEPGFPAMALPAFKERLTEANRAGLLTLNRADLPQVMEPADVEESLTRYLNGEYHFVLLEREVS